mmetsp:Transcript_61917/g.184400  ORF Transcript_61917/g.184400 Transcript_61917/m.184400 type:complete len:222 (-) Transcript_61917:67-732(-)
MAFPRPKSRSLPTRATSSRLQYSVRRPQTRSSRGSVSARKAAPGHVALKNVTVEIRNCPPARPAPPGTRRFLVQSRSASSWGSAAAISSHPMECAAKCTSCTPASRNAARKRGRSAAAVGRLCRAWWYERSRPEGQEKTKGRQCGLSFPSEDSCPTRMHAQSTGQLKPWTKTSAVTESSTRGEAGDGDGDQPEGPAAAPGGSSQEHPPAASGRASGPGSGR